jgi:glycosyltransferase involved in cell wall biosynthesis
MKILFITESFPFPLDSGGKIVSYQMLRMLSKQHAVHLVALSDQQPSRAAFQSIRSFGIKTHVFVSKKRNPWYRQSKKELFSAFLHLKPTYLESYLDSSMKYMVDKLLQKQRFDVIHVDHLSMVQYFPIKKSCTWIIQEHNIEHSLYLNFYQSSPLLSKEWAIHLYNYLTTARLEKLWLHKVDQIIVLSKKDYSALVQQKKSIHKLLIIPPYMSLSRIKNHRVKKSKNLLFIGNLWWKPNLDAIKWFIHDILPLVHKKEPSVRLLVVGDGASKFSSISLPNVRLYEKQKDIVPFLTQANIFILPFRIGQGVRIKALMAFSCELPVVATAVGMSGMDTCAEKEYLLADTPMGFAEQIISLIRSPKQQTALVMRAKMFLQKHHDPQRIRSCLLHNYAVVSMSD